MKLSHVGESGRARMVDVSGKPVTNRSATAEGAIRMSMEAFELIQSRHPLWLRKRGRNSILNDGEILVYQDNVRLGGIDVLRQMPLMSIRMIRYYDSTKAQQRYGIGHDHGVIQVLTLGGGSR